MKLFICFLSLCLAISCAQQTTSIGQTKAPVGTPVNALAPTIVYKMTGNYWQNVPVTLSDDKTQIVSYPHPKDLIVNGKLATPSPLPDGYWLDNRGISPNVAFTSWTYEAYSRLEAPPSVSELFNAIIDKNPIAEMCDCGSRTTFSSPIEIPLKALIKQKELTQKCRSLK
jgi:hypothetical protein